MDKTKPKVKPQTVSDAVRQVILESLCVEEKEVVPSAQLVRDLGMQDIDCLDVRYHLEKRFGISFSNFQREFDREKILTVAELTAYVLKKYGNRPVPPVRPERPYKITDLESIPWLGKVEKDSDSIGWLRRD